MRDGLKMRRIHAERVPAEMIELEAFGDLPDQKLINGTMRFENSLADADISVGPAIAISGNACVPEPAAIC